MIKRHYEATFEGGDIEEETTNEMITVYFKPKPKDE